MYDFGAAGKPRGDPAEEAGLRGVRVNNVRAVLTHELPEEEECVQIVKGGWGGPEAGDSLHPIVGLKKILHVLFAASAIAEDE